jgi:prephenate dehydrogenase
MTDFNSFTFGFVGLGLIGGSIAKTIRRYYPAATIIAYNPSRDTLDEAMADGVVNAGTSSADSENSRPFDGTMFSRCDMVFLCAPVQKNAENLSLLKDHLADHAILTDIGSTKRDIHEHVVSNGLARHFIGGHPMTGSERTRYRNSRAELLENAYYILSPEQEVPKESLDIFYELVTGLKAIPLVISPEFHDYAVAGISHVPHVVSASLVNLIKKSDNPDGVMKLLAAGGFRDITRISSSSPRMWQQICLTNGDNITKLLGDYIEILQRARDQIEEHRAEEIYDFFDSARRYRDSFDVVSSGATDRLWLLFVDIEDHPASLAEVVTLLAVNAISIKNIGITHNREYQEGVLRVEFNSEEELIEADEILTARNYTVHQAK